MYIEYQLDEEEWKKYEVPFALTQTTQVSARGFKKRQALWRISAIGVFNSINRKVGGLSYSTPPQLSSARGREFNGRLVREF